MNKTTEPTSLIFTLGRIAAALIGLFTLAGALIIVLYNPTPPPVTTTAVVAIREIPPYTRITASDVALRSTSQTTGLFTDTAQVVDSLTLVTIPSDTPLLADQILPLPANVWLMTVPLSVTLIHLAPGEAILLLSEDKPPVAATLLAQGDATIDVAVPAGDGPRLAEWLTSSRTLTLARQP